MEAVIERMAKIIDPSAFEVEGDQIDAHNRELAREKARLCLGTLFNENDPAAGLAHAINAAHAAVSDAKKQPSAQ